MPFRLVCFDLDQTLIDDPQGQTFWPKLHTVLEGAAGERVQEERVAAFRAGKLSYAEWVALDLGGFREQGFTRDDFERVAREQHLVQGARSTLAALKRAGFVLGVISGSLDILLTTLFPDHPFDFVLVNKVFFDAAGRISGWEATPFDEGHKHRGLQKIAAEAAIPLDETVFVGDGVNDCDALRLAGLGIAFCPKSVEVRAAADVVIEKRSLEEILPHIMRA